MDTTDAVGRYPVEHFWALTVALLAPKVAIPAQRRPDESINDAIVRTHGYRPRG